MRVIAHVERSLDGAITPESKLLFFGRRTRHKLIPSRQAIRIPRQAHVNWIAAFVWLLLMPACALWVGWTLHGFFHAIRTGW